MDKTCAICKDTKQALADSPKDSDFAKDKSRKDGFQNKCKTCQKRLSAKHFQENKIDYYRRADLQRVALRQEVQALKEASPCTDCGKFFPFWIMQFDHIGDDKVGGVTAMIAQRVTREHIYAEIAKCELVCANCHADRTYKRYMGLPLDKVPLEVVA